MGVIKAAGGWVELGNGGAGWPAAGLSLVTVGLDGRRLRLSFVTAGFLKAAGGWVEFRDGGARSWPAAGLRGSSPNRLEEY